MHNEVVKSDIHSTDAQASLGLSLCELFGVEFCALFGITRPAKFERTARVARAAGLG
jgi:hypothetical protein